MQHRTAGVLALQHFLIFQSLEGVIGVAHRQLRGVGVIGLSLSPSLDNAGETLAVLFSETVSGTFSRGGLQVVEVTGGLLQLHHAFTHVV